MFSLSAQVTCDCPEIDFETEGICVTTALDTLGYTLWAPDDCHAACWYGEDYTIVECEDDWEWEWEDECDCPDPDWDDEGVCVEITEDGYTWTDWAYSECFAACWYEDFTLVDCDDVDWGWEDECDCPEEDWDSEGICVEVNLAELDTLNFELDSLLVTWAPNECYAACWFGDFTVVECEDIDWGWGDECECSEEDWNTDGICIEVVYEDEVYVEWAPSECYAACWYEDFSVVECEDWEWEDECECSEDDWEAQGICVEITYEGEVYVEWAPSECYAACWYGDFEVTECDNDWGWEDECDCPDEGWETEGICIEITYEDETYIEWAPSECYAACWYEDFAVIDCDDWGWEDGGECDWGLECDCDLDSEEGICIAYVYEVDTLVEWVPNECFADCWGFEDYAVVDCEDFWEWEDDGEIEIEFEGDIDCINDLFTQDITTLQAFILGLGECGLFELTDCVLDAPTFDTDEEFITYLGENCPEWFGELMDESDGPSLFRQYEEAQSGGVTSTTEVIESLDVILLGNPVIDQLDIQISATDAMSLNMTLRTVTGSVLNTEKIILNQGTQVYSVSTAGMAGGTYLMTMTSEEGVQTLKFVVAN